MPELADLVEEQHAAIGQAQEAGAIVRGPGVRTLDVTEQRRHRSVAAQGGAVDLDEHARHLAPGLAQLEDLARELRLARARGAGEQDRRARADGHALDLLDQGVEAGVAGVDARLEEGQALLVLLAEARGQAVVAREVEVDDAVAAGLAAAARARRRGLQQAGREVARLGEQEETDLGDVRARGDVHEVVLVIDAEVVAAGKVVQRAEHLLEVPGVAQGQAAHAHLGVGRDLGDVRGHGLCQLLVLRRVDELEAVHEQVLVTAEVDRGAPVLPAPGALGRLSRTEPSRPMTTSRFCLRRISRTIGDDRMG